MVKYLDPVIGEVRLNICCVCVPEVLYQVNNYCNPPIAETVRKLGDVSMDEVLKVCHLHEFMLPFGADSVLPQQEHRKLLSEIHELQSKQGSRT